MADSPQPAERKPRPKGDWAKATMWMVIVFIFTLNAMIVFKSCRAMPGETIDKVSKALNTVAAAFNKGTVTTAFVSYATTLTNHQHLEFATLKQHEIFTRTEQTSTAFGYIPLPDVVVEARAPVEYNYYLDLNGQWQFVLKDNVVYVLAPPIRFNKPAVDASAITYEVRKGYLKSAEATDNLKKSISSLVVLKAKENVPLVRESVRKETADFVEKWLMKSFTDGQEYPVKVYFPGEKLPESVRPGAALLPQSNAPPP
jgi:hypothetical protein